MFGKVHRAHVDRYGRRNARASSLRANSGFNAYERVGGFGCVTVRKHSFSANEEMNEKEDEREERGSRRTIGFLFPLLR